MRVGLVAALTILIAAAAAAPQETDSLDALASTVVFLAQDTTETIKQDDKTFEVHLRDPQSGRVFPKTKRVVGTGFLVADDSRLFLVTAKHVAISMRESAQLTLRADQETPLSIKLSDLSSAAWLLHPEADVAALRLSPNAEVSHLLQRHFLPVAMISEERHAPSRDIELEILGFPLGLGASGSFSPISRRSSAASGLLVLTPSKGEPESTFFLLQDPSVGGFSGAPVFDVGGTMFHGRSITIRGGGPMVLGLVKGTVSDETGGKLALIVPSWFIRDLLKTR